MCEGKYNRMMFYLEMCKKARIRRYCSAGYMFVGEAKYRKIKFHLIPVLCVNTSIIRSNE